MFWGSSYQVVISLAYIRSSPKAIHTRSLLFLVFSFNTSCFSSASTKNLLHPQRTSIPIRRFSFQHASDQVSMRDYTYPSALCSQRHADDRSSILCPCCSSGRRFGGHERIWEQPCSTTPKSEHRLALHRVCYHLGWCNSCRLRPLGKQWRMPGICRGRYCIRTGRWRPKPLQHGDGGYETKCP